MDWLLKHLLRIRPAGWAEGGQWSVDFASVPRNDLALAVGALGVLGVWGVWWLYRKEGRGLGVPIRCVLAGLRLIVLACVLVMLAWHTRWRWPMAALMASFVVLVGLSRVYLGVHYPSDILAGWAFAMAWAVAVYLLVYRDPHRPWRNAPGRD